MFIVNADRVLYHWIYFGTCLLWFRIYIK